jgi:hypothetical protein
LNQYGLFLVATELSYIRRTVAKELDGWPPRRHHQRVDAYNPFPVHCERFAAGGEDRQPWAAAKESINESRSLLQDMFTVVEH